MTDYQAGEYAVKIIAYKSGYTSSESLITVSKNRLATPEVAIMSDEDFNEFELAWGDINCADKFIVKVGNKEYKTENKSYKIVRGESQPTLDPIIYVSSTEARVTVSAFDREHDHFISLPKELSLPQKNNLAKLTITNDNASAGSVKTVGNVYEHNQPPYKISFDYSSNIYFQGWASAESDTVSFKSGTLTASYNINEGEKIKYPTKSPVVYYNCLGKDQNNNTIYYYYIFCGWYTDITATAFFDFDVPVTNDITLYAGYKKLIVDDYFGKYKDCVATPVEETKKYFTCENGKETCYFLCDKSMTYKLYYKNYSSGSNTLIIKNLTSNKTIRSVDITTTDDSHWVTFSAKKGDIISFTRETNATRIRCDIYAESYNHTIYPTATGKAAAANYTSSGKFSTDSELFAEKGAEVTLVATEKTKGTFLGWFDENGNKVSEELEFTVTVTADAAYTAKWETTGN